MLMIIVVLEYYSMYFLSPYLMLTESKKTTSKNIRREGNVSKLDFSMPRSQLVVAGIVVVSPHERESRIWNLGQWNPEFIIIIRFLKKICVFLYT